MTKETGGPAFGAHPESANWHPSWQGMTLRDYFAAKAMAAMLPEFDLAYGLEDEICEEGETPMIDFIAKDAYIMADAMLKAREA